MSVVIIIIDILLKKTPHFSERKEITFSMFYVSFVSDGCSISTKDMREHRTVVFLQAQPEYTWNEILRLIIFYVYVFYACVFICVCIYMYVCKCALL